MENLISIIVLTVGISLVLNTILKRYRVESIIGYILTGIIITAAFGLERTHTLEVVAEFGVAFLMFSVGLQFSIKKLKAIKKRVILYGGMQFLFTSALIFALAYWGFELGVKVSVILGMGLALSSTAIVLKLINKSRKFKTTYGKNAVGILLFQDMAVLPILLLISMMAREDLAAGAVIGKTLVAMAVVVALLFFGGRVVLSRFLGWVHKSNELFIMTILFAVVGSAHLAGLFGLSYSLGAFVAGLMLAETEHKVKIREELTPFRNVLLGVFFVTVGMQIDARFMVEHLPEILALVLGLMILKALVVFVSMRVMYTTRTSLKTALILSQVGEFSFAVFSLARVNGLFLESDGSQVVLVAVAVSMLLTPFMFGSLQALTNIIVPRGEGVKVKDGGG